MKFFLLTLAVMLASSAKPQSFQYLFSYQIDSLLQLDSTPWKYQTASWNYANIGDYKKALEVREKQFPNAKASGATQDQIAFFKNFKAINAKRAILKEAKKTRILIVNEAHYSGLHRVFMASLLKDLRKLGYTLIGMEGISYDDSLLQQRAYPIIKSGFYVKEPCFGNLLREALNLNYLVFPYEQIYQDTFQVRIGRELAQALNIKKVLDKYPTSKLIVYCGYDHAAEDTLMNFMGLPMAGQLKNLTGIDPFTIDQTALSEYLVVGNRFRKLVNESKDALFIDSNQRYFNKATHPKKMDCNLYHPNTTYQGSRPTWLLRKNTRFRFIQDKVSIEAPYLIKIFLETEDRSSAVPIDVVEVKSPGERIASLVLKGKRQVAWIENSKGQTQLIPIH